MTYKFLDFLGDVSGWRPRCLDALEQVDILTGQRDAARDMVAQLKVALSEAREKVRQLELLVPRPAPPKIDYIVEKDSLWVQQRLESLGLNIIRLPLDAKYRLTNKKNFLNIVAWDITDQLEYVRNFFDCPDFAMHFMVMTNLRFRIQVCWVIDYKGGHSYNLVLFPDDSVFILEPQSDGLYLWTQRPEKFYPLTGAIVAL